jgi:hypothetical protein
MPILSLLGKWFGAFGKVKLGQPVQFGAGQVMWGQVTWNELKYGKFWSGQVRNGSGWVHLV